MIIVAADSDSSALSDLSGELRAAFSECELHSFCSVRELLAYCRELKEAGGVLDYAFLDTNIGGASGIDAAAELKETFCGVRVVFCTDDTQYALAAWELHAFGYLLKPVKAKMITRCVVGMESQLPPKEKIQPERKMITVRTFGNFSVCVDGSPVEFEREKAKELLAYLVDRRGAAVTNSEIAAVLWENDTDSKKILNYARVIITTLRRDLRRAGIDHIIVKQRNRTAIDTSLIECDMYDFIEGRANALNSYLGEYMKNYSWAEFTNAYLNEKAKM